MPTSSAIDEYQEPPDDAISPQPPAVIVPAATIASTVQTLNLLDQFFRLHASNTTRTELRLFAGLQGWDPIQGAAVLIDSIGLHAHRLAQARDTHRTHQH